MINNKFLTTYLNIIQQAKFNNPKWLYFSTIENIEIYQNHIHITNRIKERYVFLNKNIFYKKLVRYLIQNDIFNCYIPKRSNVKEFTCKMKSFNNVFLCGVLQKDREEHKNRVYISTFLPNSITFYNKNDLYFQI